MSGGGQQQMQTQQTMRQFPGNYPGGPEGPTRTLPAFMPGQQEALARQLSAGFGVPMPQMMADLAAFHTPMNVPDIRGILAPEKKPAKKKGILSKDEKPMGILGMYGGTDMSMGQPVYRDPSMSGR